MKPITALRRFEADLTLLRIEVRSLIRTLAYLAESVTECRRGLDALRDAKAGEPKAREEDRDHKRQEHE